MLVLSRRPHEKVVLPDLGVIVEVVSVEGGVVRLGIQAPPTVTVLREELVSRPNSLTRGAELRKALSKPR
jgi:carbon storage regulator CsrA